MQPARRDASFDYRRKYIPLKPLFYLSAALLSFLIFVTVFAPAAPVWSIIREDVQARVPDLNVYRVSGTIWNGESEVQFRQFPPSLLSWHLSPIDLIKGVAVIKATMTGEGHSLDAGVSLKSSGGDIRSLHGTISSGYVNQMSEQFGITFSGELEINELSVSSDKLWISDAHGTADWNGGRILITTAASPQTMILPPLKGVLLYQHERLILNITHQQQMLIRITLKKGGWAEVDIRNRMFDLASLPLPEGSDPDETILIIEEKIL
jgi:Type II secretion system (T2SS), protein N